MDSDEKPTAALEKLENVQKETEMSIPVAGEGESLPSNQREHPDKALTRKLLFKLDTRCVLLNLPSS